jgi:hypothetical protein
MDKKLEFLKAKLESTRTWLFALIGISIPLSLGYYAIENIILKKKIISLTYVIIPAIIILWIIQAYHYNKLLNYLKK